MGSGKMVWKQMDETILQANFIHYFLSFIVLAITCRITKMFSIHVNFLHLELIINCIKHLRYQMIVENEAPLCSIKSNA